MRVVQRWLAILREAILSARAQPVASTVTIIMVAGMCATVLLTTGRTVGAEQAVLGSIDSAGTRSVIIRATPEAGLDSSVLDRTAGIAGIEWIGAFGPAIDARNTLITEGPQTATRLFWSADDSLLGLPPILPAGGTTAWASRDALEHLGLHDPVGSITTRDDRDYAVIGQLSVPDFLTFLQPLVLVPQPDTRTDAIAVLVIIAETPDLVAPVSRSVQSVLDANDPTELTVETSQALAELRALVQGQLGTFGRSLIAVIFALTAVLVTAILYGLVLLRRKDFGRRRALGATRSLIATLLLIQTTLLSAIGAAVGSAAALLALTISADPLPGATFVLAIMTLASTVGTAAAIVPAIAASHRDPIKELRVP